MIAAAPPTERKVRGRELQQWRAALGRRARRAREAELAPVIDAHEGVVAREGQQVGVRLRGGRRGVVVVVWWWW